MKVIEKDITTVEEGILCHQVNCQGVMGSGVAKVIRDKWPNVFADYLAYCDANSENGNKTANMLGDFQLVSVDQNIWVGNLFAQDDFATQGSRPKVYTNYGAIQRGFEFLHQRLIGTTVPVYVPYLMGSDRGGGNWGIVSCIIDDVCPGVIACKLPGLEP